MLNHSIDVSIIEDHLTKESYHRCDRLDNLRRLSNTIQALENLVAQCEDDVALEPMRMYAEDQLEELRKVLKRQIHG